jgi:hypothetical protein
MHRNRFMRTGNSFTALTANATLYEAKKLGLPVFDIKRFGGPLIYIK